MYMALLVFNSNMCHSFFLHKGSKISMTLNLTFSKSLKVKHWTVAGLSIYELPPSGLQWQYMCPYFFIRYKGLKMSFIRCKGLKMSMTLNLTFSQIQDDGWTLHISCIFMTSYRSLIVISLLILLVFNI